MKWKSQPGDRVLEIGCGTARNLIRLARQRRDITCYGLDASNEMLTTAAAKVKSARLDNRITLKVCLAEELSYQKTFGLDGPFDTAFFSYSLSMIPTWSQAIDAALANIKRGAAFHVVDFWDQGSWPRWFAGSSSAGSISSTFTTGLSCSSIYRTSTRRA